MLFKVQQNLLEGWKVHRTDWTHNRSAALYFLKILRNLSITLYGSIDEVTKNTISPPLRWVFWKKIIMLSSSSTGPQFTFAIAIRKTRTTRTPAFWGYTPPPSDYPYHWVILHPKSKEDKVKVTNQKNSPKFQIFNFETGITRDTPSEVAW